MNEQLIADAKQAGFDFTDNLFCIKELTAFAAIIRKRHEHIRTDNGVVIAKLQADLDKANAEIKKYTCPINSMSPEVCSAGTCYECLVERLKYQYAEIEILKSDFAVQRLHTDRAFDELRTKDAEIARLRETLEKIVEAIVQGEQNEV
jgi:hypothetical protein